MPVVRSVLSFDGVPIEYEVDGDGPPLVLLHGILSSRRSFSRQRDALSQHFRLILVSARGHDGSGTVIPPNYGVGTSDLADLYAVLNAENIGDFSLIGHSSGGATAFVAACRTPERVQRLILIEPTLYSLMPRDHAEAMIEPILTADRPMAALKTLLSMVAGPAWNQLSEAAQATRLRGLSGCAPFVGPHNRGLLDLTIRDADVTNLRPPTLLVYGANSFPFESVIAGRFRSLRPDLPLHTIARGGHNIHREQAAAFNALAVPFLTAR